MQTSSQPIIDKWQRMQHIVNQSHAVSTTNYSRQFNKLVMSRLLTENILTFLLQYIGIMLLDISTPHAIAPVWYASGTACAFLFMRGVSVSPGIFLGSFIAYYFSSYSIFQSVCCGGIDTLQPLLLLRLSYRYISPSLLFHTTNQCIRFIYCCGIVTALSSLMIAILNYPTFDHSITLSAFWLRLWLGNLNGIFVFAFAILTWDFYCLQVGHIKTLNKWLISCYYGLLILTIILLLSSHTIILTLIYSLLTIPIVLLISLHLGWCGVIVAMFIFGLVLNFSTYLNLPLFSTQNALPSLIYIQFILFIETIIGLFIAIRK